MLTPKQMSRLGDIVSQETPQANVSVVYGDYLKAVYTNQSYSIGGILRVSPVGKVEALRQVAEKSHILRQKNRALVRVLVRVAKDGFEVGWATREWLGLILRSEDFRREAEGVMVIN